MSAVRFRAGIIAAGHGDRLRNHSNGLPKPLLPVAGKPLLDWTLEALWSAGAQEVVCILNEQSVAVSSYAIRRWSGKPLRFIHKTTTSSYESFRHVAQALGGDRFLITTVDGIFDPQDLQRFVRFSLRSDWEVVLGVTDFVDDENPLRASFESNGRLMALGAAAESSPYVTAGFYWCSQHILDYDFPSGQEPRSLREFLGSLCRAHVSIGTCRIGKVVDVDRPADVAEAESYLKEAGLVQH